MKYMVILYNDIVTELSVCLSFPLLWVPAPLFPEKNPEYNKSNLSANQNKSNGTMEDITISSFLSRAMLSVQIQMLMKILGTLSFKT
jgi:hypothetical protein